MGIFSSGTEHTGCCQHVLAELELTAHLSPPPPPQVTDMESMFQSSNFNGNMTTWNTGKVATMKYVHRGRVRVWWTLGRCGPCPATKLVLLRWL